ncbi:hypothetical protein R3P38DRAFT_2986195 [Favolaschia claudopus]|uniref:Uncharacterized protein n=1 Tax=Favolaschia claudopus TaxID=2862362 RepID=A0AAW0AVH4_9AGAR
MAPQDPARKLCRRCRTTMPLTSSSRYVRCPDCRAEDSAKRQQRQARHDDMIRRAREAIERLQSAHHPSTASLSQRDTVRSRDSMIQIQVSRQTTSLRASSRRTSAQSTDSPPSYRASNSRDSENGQFLRALLEEVGLASHWFSILHARGVTEGSIRTLQRLAEARRVGILKRIAPEMNMVDRVLFADAILHIDSTAEF